MSADKLTPETVKVGDGVTEQLGSDRYAGTIFKVSPTGKTFQYTCDSMSPGEGHDYRSNQTWVYETVEPYDYVDQFGIRHTNICTVRWSEKAGRFLHNGRSVYPGRFAYRDPSF